MLIHLKKNERLFINGAVLRLDRRGTVELLNDAQFLLENHVMQPESATTPLRQLYFVIQTMIIDPANAHLTKMLFETVANQIVSHSARGDYISIIGEIRSLVAREGLFEALKHIRKSYALEAEILKQAEMSAENHECAA
jgi:flagellar biosynthesis repressor protein FlbT